MPPCGESILTEGFKVVYVGIVHHEIASIKLHPNPTTGELHVTSDALHVTNVEIFDVYGKKQSHTSRVTSNENTINIAHLSAGLYFVKIRTEAGEVVKKVIKL